MAAHNPLERAELVKVAANSFLATKISFSNAMAEACEAAGSGVTRLAEALAHDDRTGAKFLAPGLGQWRSAGWSVRVLGRP